jgi:DNA mismatch repair protein MutS
LARLESQALDATPQLDLFAPPPCDDTEAPEAEASAPSAAPASLLALLDGIDPDALTPREALQKLYDLKRLAGE